MRDQHHRLSQSLGNEKAVEGVPVKVGEGADAPHVRPRRVQRQEARGCELFCGAICVDWHVTTPERVFDRDLPQAHCAHEHASPVGKQMPLLLEPFDLIARICALVPPPRVHMVRYHGVLSSHAKARHEVVPQPAPRSAPGRVVQLELFAASDDITDNTEPRRKPWAWLLRHVFGEDLQSCPHCAGPMRWLEVATAPDAIARLLAKHGLGPRPPPRKRAPTGQLRLAFPEA